MRRAHAAYGDALQITEAADEAPAGVREPKRQVEVAIQEYVFALFAEHRPSVPKSIPILKKALAPIDALRAEQARRQSATANATTTDATHERKRGDNGREPDPERSASAGTGARPRARRPAPGRANPEHRLSAKEPPRPFDGGGLGWGLTEQRSLRPARSTIPKTAMVITLSSLLSPRSRG